MAQFSISAVFRVVNQATQPLREVGKGIRALSAPIKKVGNDFANYVGRKARSAFSSLTRWAKRAALGLTAMAVAGGYALLRFTKMADTIGKVADKLGITTDQLQAWRFAAEQSGLSAEQFDVALRYFTKSIGEVKLGVGEGKKAFEEMRIGLKKANGEQKTNAELMSEVADKLTQVKDHTLKAGLAYKLFGRSGVDLLNMIRKGSKGLEEFRMELEKRGGIIPEDVIRNSEKFNDSLNLTKKMIIGLLAHAIGPFLPWLIELVKNFQEWVIANKDLIKTKLEEWGKRVSSIVEKLPEHLSNVVEQLKFIKNYIDNIDKSGFADFLRWSNEILKRIGEYETKRFWERKKREGTRPEERWEVGPLMIGRWKIGPKWGTVGIPTPTKKEYEEWKKNRLNIGRETKSKIEIGIQTAPGLQATVDRVDKGGADIDIFTKPFLGHWAMP